MIQTLSTKLVVTADLAKQPNLTDRFGEDDLTTLGNWVYDGYTRDKNSRAKWEKRMEAAMDLAMQIQKDKNFPWPGCANTIFPLVTIAALQFSSRSYGNIIQGTDVVKYRVVGKDVDMRLQQQADRISRHMSWQVLEEDSDWEEQTDRLLINLGIVGCNFKKSYYNSGLRHQVSELVMARDFVIDYWAKSVEGAARKTQVIPMYRNEIYERIIEGRFRDVRDEAWYQDIPPAAPTNAQQDNRWGQLPPTPPDRDTPFRMLEQHCLLDLDQDGYAEPYICTIDEASHKVVKLVARWEREEDVDRRDFPGGRRVIKRINATEYYTKFGFIPAPDGGIYDLGFGILLGPLNESVNTIINQLHDFGTMATSNGGFLGRGVKIRGGLYTVPPWTWKRVDSTGDDLRKAMVPFPVPDPPDVLFKLLGLLIEYTERIAGTTDPMVGVNPGQNTPAETSRNTLEQGMKVYSGIFKRVWRSLKEEFKKRHQLNAMFLESKKHFGTGDSWITQEDYRTNPDLVVPAADPNIVSDQLRLIQAQAVRTSAHEVPGYDVAFVEKNIWLKALKVDAIESVYPGADKVPALPNPKAMVEQLKLQGVQMKIQYEKWKVIQTLQAAQRKTMAEITNLNAQTIKLMAETQTEKVRAKVEAFEAIVAALQAHNDMMTNNIETMMALQEGDKGEDQGKSGTMGGMGSPSGDSGSQGAPSPGAGGAPGTVGGGAVSG